MLTLLALAFTAHGQDLVAIDADPFEPSGSLAHANGTIQGEHPHLTGEGLALGVHANIAEDLVVLGFADGREEPVLSEVFGTTVYSGYTYQDLFRIDVFLPVYAYAEAPIAPFAGAAMGDVRIQGVIPIYQYGDEFEFSVAPAFSLPTGTKRALLHRGVHGQIDLLAGGEYEGFGYLANIGLTMGPPDSLGPVRMGSTFDAVVGAFYRLEDSFRVGGDLDFHVGLAGGDADEAPNSLGTGHLFVQTISDLGLTGTIGAGTGIVAGVGAPEYRVFASVGYAPIVSDKDKDGFIDSEDSCPLEPEDFDEWEDDDGCPEADNDSDGLVDTADRCPNEAEDPDGFDDSDGCPEYDNDLDDVLDVDDECPLEPGPVDNNGCPKPPDTDEDGLLDDVDQCPEEPGPIELNGCPDRDGDGVPDFRDRCPDDVRPAEEDARFSDGCPKRVFYSGKTITITDKVLFDSGKSRIKSESFTLLDEVAGLLKANPWIQKIEVGGHTDSQGGEAMNKALSEKRAAAVVGYLKGKGVVESRVTSKGYGEEQPISSNRTAVGRAKNRRVEFKITKQTPPTQERAFNMTTDKTAPKTEPKAEPKPEPPAPAPEAAPALPPPPGPPPPSSMGPRGSAASTAPGAVGLDGESMDRPAAPAEGAAEEPAAPQPKPASDSPWDDPDAAPDEESGQGDFDALFDAAFEEADEAGELAPPPGEDTGKGRKGRKSAKVKKGKKGKNADRDELPDELDPLRLLDGFNIEEDGAEDEPAPWDDPEAPREGEEEDLLDEEEDEDEDEE